MTFGRHPAGLNEGDIEVLIRNANLASNLLSRPLTWEISCCSRVGMNILLQARII
jgi:hypothetical protein